MQKLPFSSQKLRLYDDWWQHDGLHFDKHPLTFHDLFAVVETPRAIFEASPIDDEVFIGVAPEDMRWYLRFRAEWDADDQNLVGRFAVMLPADLSEQFKREVVCTFEHSLVEKPAQSYYKSVKA